MRSEEFNLGSDRTHHASHNGIAGLAPWSSAWDVSLSISTHSGVKIERARAGQAVLQRDDRAYAFYASIARLDIRAPFREYPIRRYAV